MKTIYAFSDTHLSPEAERPRLFAFLEGGAARADLIPRKKIVHPEEVDKRYHGVLAFNQRDWTQFSARGSVEGGTGCVSGWYSQP